MENKYMETEEKCVDLEIEDLEIVAGGRKWGSDSKGPRTNIPAGAEGRVLAEIRENEAARPYNASEIEEVLRKSGVIK